MDDDKTKGNGHMAMTIDGPRHLNGNVLMVERLGGNYSSPCSCFKKDECVPLSLNTLSSYFEYPCQGENGKIESTRDLVFELNKLKEWDCTTIVDITLDTEELPTRMETLKTLSKQTQMSIIIGTGQEQKHANKHPILIAFEMEQKLIRKVCPAGYLGPFPSDIAPFILEAAVLVQERRGTPIYLLMDITWKRRLLEYTGNKKNTILCHADSFLMDIPNWLQLGYMISIDSIGLASVAFKNCRKPLQSLSCDYELILHLNVWYTEHKHQLLFSHGLGYKTQLQTYGGHGLSYLFQYFLPKVQENISKEDCRIITQETPYSILHWYLPWKVQATVVLEQWPCYTCDALFEPIEGYYYSKFIFNYCSMSCLRKHKKEAYRVRPT